MKPKKTAKATPSRREEVLTDFATLRIPVTAEQLDAALKQAQDAGLTHLDFLHRLESIREVAAVINHSRANSSTESLAQGWATDEQGLRNRCHG
jgi:hypothetical protein